MPIPSILDPHTSMIRTISMDLVIPLGTPSRLVSSRLDPTQPAFTPSGASRSLSPIDQLLPLVSRQSSVSPTNTSSSDGTPLTPPPYMYRMTAHGPVLCVNAGALPPPEPETDEETKTEEDEPMPQGIFYKDTAHGRVLCVEEPIFDEACIADISLSSEDDSVVV